MPTIAYIVESLLEKKPFIQEALAMGLINNAALAEQLQPQIERIMKKKTKFSAINMSIRRLSEKLNQRSRQAPGFDEDCDITIKTGLCEITIYKKKDTVGMIRKKYNQLRLSSEDFITISQGVNELTVIINNRLKGSFLSLIPKAEIKKEIGNLSSVMIKLPRDAESSVGLFYIITKALAWNNINIVEMVSTYSELTLFFTEEDTSDAFSVIKDLIKDNIRNSRDSGSV
jgi:aspartokinase